MRKCIKKQGLPFASRFCHIFVWILHSSLNQYSQHTTHDVLNHTQKHPIGEKQPYTIMHTQSKNLSYFAVFEKYGCDMCVSYLYYKPFLGTYENDRLSPLFVALWLRCLLKKFFSENFRLIIKIVLWKFFIYFFYL